MPREHVIRSTGLVLVMLLFGSLLLSGCDKCSLFGSDEEKTISLKKANEGTKRAPVPACGNNIKCAKKGEGCRFLARADEPADCSKPPTIICECPADKTCVLTTTGTDDWKCISNLVLENQ